MAKPQHSALQERCVAEENIAFVSCIAYRPKSMASVCFVEQHDVFNRCMGRDALQKASAEAQIQKGAYGNTKPHTFSFGSVSSPSKHSRPADLQ